MIAFSKEGVRTIVDTAWLAASRAPLSSALVTDTFLDGAANKRVHMVGARGAGMSALADVLQQCGCTLSGSDCASGAVRQAAWIRNGHDAAHVPPDCDLVVHSPAVPDDNGELVRARALGISTFSYPQMLGRLMSERRGLAVAGTHGKSTTTAMTAAILRAAELDPTVVMGATPHGASSGGRRGQGELLLVEACEYRRHFKYLRPELAVVLGIEWDHVDCFSSLLHVEAAFDNFAAGIASDGLLLGADACPVTRRVVARAGRRSETFGLGPGADWQPIDLQLLRGHCQFTIVYRGQPICAVALRVPGRHNVQNALAAAALAWHSGAGGAAIRAGLSGFCGLKRRLEWLGEAGGITVVDDYAHHPTEVAASLAALRACFGKRRLWCVFQPHQAARTRALLDELAGSMHNADRVVVADVFLAREPAGAADSVRASDLARRILARGGNVATVHETNEIEKLLRTALRPGDVLVTMGAGDIGKIAHDFVQRF